MSNQVSYRSRILGTGHYLPTQVITNEELCKRVDTSHEWIVERTGIHERRIATPGQDETPSGMAYRAAKEALKNANLEPSDIDFILFSVTVPDMLFPNTASVLQEKLGIAGQCACLDINAACTGWIYGYVLADSLIRSNSYKKILLVGCEMTSTFNNWKDRSTCILFGDGCGAVILGRSEDGESSQLLSQVLSSDGSKKEHLILRAGGSANPVTKEIIDREEQYTTMNGQEVFKAAVKTLTSQAEYVLSEAHLTKENIKFYIPHQANLRIIEAVAHRLQMPMEKVIVNVQKYANTSSASIPIALHETIQQGKIQRGDKLLLGAFGAGLTSGSVCIEY